MKVESGLGRLGVPLPEATRFLRRLTELPNLAVDSWESATALLPHPRLADLLGERHRIIANDWQAAELCTLIGRLITRALAIIGQLELSPPAIRADLASARTFPGYLYSASEVLDRAADLAAESATLVHENERRWRVFRARASTLALEGASENRGR